MDSYASIHVHGENGGRFNRYDHGASSRHSDFYHCGSIPSQCWQCQHYADPGEISLLDQYVLNLYNLYLKDPYVHVLPLMTHSHIAGSVAKALGITKSNTL